MKKICLVARQNIYKDSTHLHDDNGLRALNGIKYGKVHEIEDNEDPLNIWHSLRLEFKKENPTFHADQRQNALFLPSERRRKPKNEDRLPVPDGKIRRARLRPAPRGGHFGAAWRLGQIQQ